MSNLYFHKFAARSQQISAQLDVYEVGITPVMNRFVPKLNAPDILKGRFSVSDFIELRSEMKVADGLSDHYA